MLLWPGHLHVRPRVKTVLIHPGVFFAAAALCTVSWAAELGLGDALARESAVSVISAQSQEDLDQSVSAWVHSRFPGSRVVSFRFEYIDDTHAWMVVRAIDGTKKLDLYFKTPGLPAQFVGRKQ